MTDRPAQTAVGTRPEPVGSPVASGRRWTVVFPMYREATRIEASVAQLAGSKLAHPDVELLFVDDGSDDDTAGVTAAALARHGLAGRVIRLASNQGKGAAVRAGVLEATGEVVGFADADLSSGPDDIVRVFACVDSGEADLAVASRTDPASTIAGRQPFLRRTSGWAYNLLLKALGLTAMSDTQCGLKASTAAAARALYGPLSTRRFAFDVEVVARAERLGLRIAEVPVTWSHVEASRVRPVRDGLRAVGDAVRIRRIVGR